MRRVNLPNSHHKKKSNYEVTVVLTILVEAIILQYIHGTSSCCISYTYSVLCQLYHSKAGKKINKNMSFTSPTPHSTLTRQHIKIVTNTCHQLSISHSLPPELQVYGIHSLYASSCYHRTLFCQMFLSCEYESPAIWLPISLPLLCTT